MTTKYSSYLVKLKVTLLLLVLTPSSSRQNPSMAVAAPTSLPGCPDKCGNVVILYPFGTKDGCFLPGFQIICNDTFQPPRAFFPAEYSKSNPDLDFVVSSKPQIMTEHGSYFNDTDGEERRGNISMLPVEIISFSVAQGKLRVRAPFCYKCRLNKMYHSYRRKMEIYFPDRSPFFLSKESTVLMGIGYKVVAQQQFGPSCEAVGSSIENGTCFGRGCCQAILLPQTNDNIVIIATGLSPPQRRARLDIGRRNEDECTYAMLVDKSWYNFTSLDLDSDTFLRRNDARGVPVVVDFVMANHSCPLPGQQVPEWYACARDNTVCVQVPFYDDTGYLCNCSQGYQGNPYIPHGCRDIDECEMPDLYPCHGICHNREGGYECACPAGTKGNATQGQCTEMFPLPAKAAVGAIGCLFVIALVVFFLLLRRQKRKMKHFFMKNGGPALEKANNIKIYRREELKPILRSSNFIGKGCFGEVYKGYLDNRLVAVKKPITDTVAHNEQFANEVIIQSRVIHKNIVRLIGCCLEVDIPMLVYEFLSNGSLDDTLHSNNKVPLDIDVRFNIAAESAEGLAYMHSKTGNIILHGDVKPANILLNDDYVPKISDFGISRLIARDKEHTTSVIGDRTYMDPVYLQTGLLTEKSDVYSFGVLLLELVSRRKATYSDHNSLVRNFVDAHKKDEMPIELFDKEFVEPRDLELLGSLARVAVECLNLDVDERPAMTDVAERLLMLKRSRN